MFGASGSCGTREVDEDFFFDDEASDRGVGCHAWWWGTKGGEEDEEGNDFDDDGAGVSSSCGDGF